MKIEQFEDKPLSHYSYAILSECKKEVVLIDPSRNIQPYLDYAGKHGAKIIGVIETHPHADFISGHLELYQTTGAILYCSHLVGAGYPHQSFDQGNQLSFGSVVLKAINTPGHSPDSICIILSYHGVDKVVFTGDTLFIGDCGRPDLREAAGNITARRNELAAQMYWSLRTQLMPLHENVLVYPAHGAGTLCGKVLSDAKSSSIGEEKLHNWALQEMAEELFIKELNAEQPFIPAYFSFDVELNRKGAEGIGASFDKVKILSVNDQLENDTLVLDVRSSDAFKAGHLPGAINLMADGKFETWLGTIILPEEKFYLVAADENVLKEMILRSCKIGYERFIKGAFILNSGAVESDLLNLTHFKSDPLSYTIVDVRNLDEVITGFEGSIHIPLPEMRKRINEIPVNKPVMVHCAGGYRSAIASSLLEKNFQGKVKIYDLSTAVTDFF